MMMRRLLVVRGPLAAAATIIVAFSWLAPAQAATAGADKPSGKPASIMGIEALPAADQARQRAQEPLLRLNDRVYDVTSRSYDAHFAGAALDVQNNALVVYWAGSVPIELSVLRAQAAGSGSTLTIKPAKFSRKQLMAAADQVMPTAEVAGSVELAVDGSGLTVAVGDLPAVARGERLATDAESRLLQRIADTRTRTGVPVSVVAARPGTPRFSANTRHNDSSPYWAGAQIARYGDLQHYCTSGFSMYASGAPWLRYTLTAAHCANFSDDVTMINGVGQAMGVSDFVHEFWDHVGLPFDPAYDLGVVRLKDEWTNQGLIYIYEDSSAGGIPVTDYASGGIPAYGNYCVHGLSAPGVNCNLWSGGQTRKCPEGSPHCFYAIEFTPYDDRYYIWCLGDSGGPIYFWTGGTVVAAGVVSYAIVPPGHTCAYSGGASVVATAVNLIPGLTVLTWP